MKELLLFLGISIAVGSFIALMYLGLKGFIDYEASKDKF